MTTPNMNLTLPTVSVTSGPTWASELNAAVTTIDEHDHSSGKGVQVTPAGLNINSDLSIGSNNLNLVRSLRMASQSGTLTGGSDLRCIYSYNGNLYFNNASGTAIQLTSGAAINAAALVNNSWEELAVSAHTVILPADTYVLLLVNTSAARNITLPAANGVAVGRYYIIKDVTGSSETNNITIIPAGTDTIDGTPSGGRSFHNNGGTVIFVSDGVSNWATLYLSSKNQAEGTFAQTSGTTTLGATAGTTVINGSIQTAVRATAADLTIDTTTKDVIVLVDTSAARAITLPTPAAGRVIWIKDKTGSAATNNITLTRHGSEKIEGVAANRTLRADWGVWCVASDGTDWFLIQ